MITARCSCCGYEESYRLSREESGTLQQYRVLGRKLGMIQNLFPKVPAWIRSGAIDRTANGFCICPECSGITHRQYEESLQ